MKRWCLQRAGFRGKAQSIAVQEGEKCAEDE